MIRICSNCAEEEFQIIRFNINFEVLYNIFRSKTKSTGIGDIISVTTMRENAAHTGDLDYLNQTAYIMGNWNVLIAGPEFTSPSITHKNIDNGKNDPDAADSLYAFGSRFSHSRTESRFSLEAIRLLGR